MLAEQIMTTEVLTVLPDDEAAKVIPLMKEGGVRMIPVVDSDGKVAGMINSLSLLGRIVPKYIASGDLDGVSYAPDIGVFKQKFCQLRECKVRDVMEPSPTLVHPDDSLLSVAAALFTEDRYDCVIVVDDDNRLCGVISASDILFRLKLLAEDEECDA